VQYDMIEACRHWKECWTSTVKPVYSDRWRELWKKVA